MKITALASTAPSLLVVLGIFACGSSQKKEGTTPVGASFATAQPEPEDADPGTEGGVRRRSQDGGGFDRLLDRFDDNGDGHLQVSELPPRMEQHLGDADADGDGIVTRDELKKEMRARGKTRFRSKDKNRDGELTEDEVDWMWKHLAVADVDQSGGVSLEELQEAHAAGRLGHRMAYRSGHPGVREWGPGCGRMMGTGALIERYDKNGDGALEFDELPDRQVERLADLDTNHNGALTQDELEAHRAAREKAHFEDKDENGDGFLTRREVGRRWAHVGQADLDGDGRVSQEELEAARESGEMCDKPHRGDRTRRHGRGSKHGGRHMKGRHGGRGRHGDDGRPEGAGADQP